MAESNKKQSFDCNFINKRMMKYTCILIILTCISCNLTTKLTVGLSLKKHSISDTEILEKSKSYCSNSLAIGMFDSNFFFSLINDSSLYNYKNFKDKSKFINLIVQPLNCMFFDENNKLVASYSICDADFIKTRLSWQDYLSSSTLVQNINVKQKITFDILAKHIITLNNNSLENYNKNVILCWSKVGGRQTKFFFKEFTAYLSKHEYNIYIINCDDAMNKFDMK